MAWQRSCYGIIGLILMALASQSTNAAELKVISGYDESGNFGSAVRLAGDINGDGIADVISGAPTADVANKDDGYAAIVDLASGYQQEAFGANFSKSEAGYSVDGAADYNCDGFKGEVTYSLPGHEQQRGKVSVHKLAPLPYSWVSLYGTEVGERLGHVARLLDVDLDGCADLVASGPGFGAKSGKVVAYAGTTGSQLFELFGTKGAYFGSGAIEVTRFVDGSTHALLIASPEDDQAGKNSGSVRAYSIVPSVSGTVSLTALWTRSGVKKDAQFGSALAADVDVDQDGISDVLVSAPKAGYVELLSGADGSLLRVWKTAGNRRFGAALSFARDFSGDDDAIPDVLVGAPAAGLVFGFSSAGVQKTPLAVWAGSAKEGYGTAVLGVNPRGDLEWGDGGVALVVGAPNRSKRGALYFFDSYEPCENQVSSLNAVSGVYQGSLEAFGCPSDSGVIKLSLQGPPGSTFRLMAAKKISAKGKLSTSALCSEHLLGSVTEVTSGVINAGGEAQLEVSLSALGLSKNGHSRGLQVNFYLDPWSSQSVGCSTGLQVSKQLLPS